MAANSVTITASAEGKTLEELQRIIAIRQKALAETTSQAVTATAINILSSLKPQAKVARKKAVEDDYKVEEICDVGWRGGKGSKRRVPINAGHAVKGVYPVNWMYGLTGSGKLYRITITNPNIRPKIAKNAPVYYVMAPNLTVAAKFAAARVQRALDRERGLARGVIGYAQAKVSNRPMSDAGQLAVAKGKLIATAATVTIDGSGFSSGNFSIEFFDKLKYSVLAQKGGNASLLLAMQKAANKTAGLINHYIHQLRFDGPPVPTPFPEASRRK